jgi:hypothetical protein
MPAGKMPAMVGSARLFPGIDVVDIGRLRDVEGLERRILAPAERSLRLGPEPWSAVVLAVKEACIKSAGGRPPSFAWQRMVVGPSIRACSELELLVTVVRSDLQPSAEGFLAVAVDRCLREWIRSRFDCPPRGDIAIDGWWGMTETNTVALTLARLVANAQPD